MVKCEHNDSPFQINNINDQSFWEVVILHRFLFSVDTSKAGEAPFQSTGITGNLLANCVLVSDSNKQLSLILDSAQSALYNDEHGRRIKQALNSFYGEDYSIELTIGVINSESPAQYQARQRAEALEHARTEFANDEHVKALIETFSGHIVPDSVSIINEVKK